MKSKGLEGEKENVIVAKRIGTAASVGGGLAAGVFIGIGFGPIGSIFGSYFGFSGAVFALKNLG